MSELLPTPWIVAHRCVDLSARFGSEPLDRLVGAARSDENALASMEARFRAGFGVETDLRGDARAAEAGILISHDPPVFGGDHPTLAQVFDLYRRVGERGCLALNVKDSGLQARLKPMLDKFGVTNYFTFDGAVPDVLADGLFGITAFGRESEMEPFDLTEGRRPLPNYATVAGVWMDNFQPGFWIDDEAIARHFARGKDVALVSPELHGWGRQDRGETLMRYWTLYRASLEALRPKFPLRRLLICTKFPSLARDFFNV